MTYDPARTSLARVRQRLDANPQYGVEQVRARTSVLHEGEREARLTLERRDAALHLRLHTRGPAGERWGLAWRGCAGLPQELGAGESWEQSVVIEGEAVALALSGALSGELRVGVAPLRSGSP